MIEAQPNLRLCDLRQAYASRMQKGSRLRNSLSTFCLLWRLGHAVSRVLQRPYMRAEVASELPTCFVRGFLQVSME